MIIKTLAGVLAFAITMPAVARELTATDLAGLSRISDPAVSPDGHWLVWQQRETDMAENRGRTDIWRLDLTRNGAVPEALAALAKANETAPAFSKDGRWVYFLSDQRDDDAAVWRVAVTGGQPEAVTTGKLSLSGFKLSPDENKLLVWADRPSGAASIIASAKAANPDAGSARTYDQLFVRHWDTWANGDRSQPFVMTLVDGKATGAAAPIVGKLVGDTPSKPMGGGEELAWSADSKSVFFALREAGRIEPTSTNMDIFEASANGTSEPVNLTTANDATDTMPLASPDGHWLAYTAMARPTYESDRLVIQLRDLRDGTVRALTAQWDVSVASLAWSADSKNLFVTAEDNFDTPLFRVDITTGKPVRLTGAGSVKTALPLANGDVIVAMDSLTAPVDLFRIDGRGRATPLTHVNAARLAGVNLPTTTKFSFKGADDDIVWAYAVKPANLPKDAKAPVAFLVHGGPQGSFGNTWSYRWNPAVFAGAGFATVLVDFHGSTGHGQAFTDSINKDWGGKPLTDLKRGLAATAVKFAWADTQNACAAGGSYGGYMMNWIAGKWTDGFKCLVNHAGVFDARGMAYTTEELWFDEWEHGGPYYENATEYERWNPVNHVADWKTPMLVIHGEKDFRIPYVQGLGAFTALQRRNIPSRLVVFPDENHWILKPKNNVQWYGEVLGWMKHWTVKPR